MRFLHLLLEHFQLRKINSCLLYTSNSGKTIYFITAWRTPLDTWRGAFDKTGGTPNTHSANDRTQREADALQGVLAKAESARTLFTLDAANCTAVCYSQNNGQDDVLLCGSMNGGIISLPRLALGYYVLLSLAPVSYTHLDVYKRQASSYRRRRSAATVPSAR